MRALGVITVLAILAGGAAYLFRDVLLPPEPVAVTPAIERHEPPPGDMAADEDMDPAVVEEAARSYVAALATPAPRPVAVERADHFVGKDQALALISDISVEAVSPESLFSDPSLPPDTPITVVRTVEQVESPTPEQLIAEAGGDLDRTVRVLEGNTVRERTVRDVLEDLAAAPDRRVDVVRDVEYFEKTTPAEIQRSGSFEPGQDLKVIRKPYSMGAATVSDLLIGEEGAVETDSVFYVRTVRPDDAQGIWGIVHDAIIFNFARGIAVRNGQRIDTYRVDIPREADERLSDNSSSFLGGLIHQKARQTYVYNYREGRMGQNPDVVSPGMEIVIVRFSPEELRAIYRHFVVGNG